MVIIGCDHAGFEMKNEIVKYFKDNNLEYLDVCKQFDENDDYPDVAKKICSNVLESSDNIGIAICGTGIGISIACNKIKKIRAALCYTKECAILAKEHNNANVLCLGGRQNYDNVEQVVNAFLYSKFEQGRHQKRIEKIYKLEEEN